MEDLSQLLFPTRCFGCSAIGLSICATCQRDWNLGCYSTRISKLKVHSAVIYSPMASKILLAAKENGIRQADTLIVDAIVHVLKLARFTNQNICLVPIPSSPSARRRRGRSFVVEIASKAAAQMGTPLFDCLETQRKLRDQSGLKPGERATNMKGAFSLKLGTYPRGDLILVDDVVTTGATLCDAARALESAGFHVLASVTACVAQPLR